MKQSSFTLRSLNTLIALLSVLLAFPVQTFACAGLWDGQAVAGIALRSEDALIVWESEKRTEHFIRKVQFSGASPSFGFLVPIPSKPDVAASDAAIFTSLRERVAPRIASYRLRMRHSFETRYTEPPPFFGGYPNTFYTINSTLSVGAAPSARAAPLPKYEVIESKKIGALDTTILKANTLDGLKEWAAKNNFQLRSSVEEWASNYIGADWHFVAFKYEKGAASEITSETVRISFTTDKIFYPYREPAGEINNNRIQRLYFLSPKGVSNEAVDSLVQIYLRPPYDPDWDRPGVDLHQRLAFSQSSGDLGDIVQSAVGHRIPELEAKTAWLQLYTDTESRREQKDLWLGEGATREVVSAPIEALYIVYPWWFALLVICGLLVSLRFYRNMPRTKAL